MAVQKVLIRDQGVTKQYTPKDTSAGAADAGALVALGSNGKLDMTLLPSGLGDGTRIGTASEALVAGNFVQEYANAGTWSVRKADNSNGRWATGFVKAASASSAPATVYPLDGVNDQLTGLTIGTVYYLGTAGGTIASPLNAASAPAGSIDQKLGIAKSATELVTDDFDYVVL